MKVKIISSTIVFLVLVATNNIVYAESNECGQCTDGRGSCSTNLGKDILNNHEKPRYLISSQHDHVYNQDHVCIVCGNKCRHHFCNVDPRCQCTICGAFKHHWIGQVCLYCGKTH